MIKYFVFLCFLAIATADFTLTSVTNFQLPADPNVVAVALVNLCGGSSGVPCEFVTDFEPPAELQEFVENTNVAGIRWGRPQNPEGPQSGLLFLGLNDVLVTNDAEYFPVGILVHENWVIFASTKLEAADSSIQLNLNSGLPSPFVAIPLLINETNNVAPCQFCGDEFAGNCAAQVVCPDTITINLPAQELVVPFETEIVTYQLRFFPTYPPTGDGSSFMVTQELQFNHAFLFGRVVNRVPFPKAFDDVYTVNCSAVNAVLSVLDNDDSKGLTWDLSSLVINGAPPTHGTAVPNTGVFQYTVNAGVCNGPPQTDVFNYCISTTDGQTTCATVTIHIVIPQPPLPPQRCVQVTTGDVSSCNVTVEVHKQLVLPPYDVNCTLDFVVPASSQVSFALSSDSEQLVFEGQDCCDTSESLSLIGVNATEAVFLLSTPRTTIAHQMAVLIESICIRCFASICVSCEAPF